MLTFWLADKYSNNTTVNWLTIILDDDEKATLHFYTCHTSFAWEMVAVNNSIMTINHFSNEYADYYKFYEVTLQFGPS